MFERNESALDRVARLVVGGGLVAVSVTSLGVSSAKPLGILVGVLGAVLSSRRRLARACCTGSWE